MLKPTLLLLFALTVLESGCIMGHIVVPNTEACSVAGVFSAGGFCAETISGKTRDLTMNEYLDFLEAQPERPDPFNEGKTLPARAGAICQSTSDWNEQKTALEVACRILGKNCTYELEQTIKNMQLLSDNPKRMMLK